MQGVAVFQGRDYTFKYVEFLKNRYNAVDEPLNGAIILFSGLQKDRL